MTPDAWDQSHMWIEKHAMNITDLPITKYAFGIFSHLYKSHSPEQSQFDLRQ